MMPKTLNDFDFPPKIGNNVYTPDYEKMLPGKKYKLGTI